MSFKSSALCVCVVFLCVAAAVEEPTAELLKSIDDLDSEQSVYLFGGLSIDRIGDGVPTGPRSATAEPIFDRAVNYLQSHQIKFSINDDGGDVEEARGRVKKILLPLLLAFKLKMALILPIVLKAIALISLKGLLAGTLALIFSGATFVKDLLSKKQEHVTTAYISGGANPVNAEFVHHGGDWNRNGQVSAAQDLAYNYHTMPQFGHL